MIKELRYWVESNVIRKSLKPTLKEISFEMSDLFLKLLEELEKCFKFADTVSHNFEAGICKVKLPVHVATELTWSGFGWVFSRCLIWSHISEALRE